MSFSKRTVIIVSAAMGLLAITSSSPATTYWSSSLDCKAFGSSGDVVNSYLVWDLYGINNPVVGTTPFPVECPMHWQGSGQAPSGETATVYYYDASLDPDNGSLDCHVTAVDSSFTTYIGTTVYSCSTAGGCSNPAPAYVGTNYLTLPALSGTRTYIQYAAKCNIPGAGVFGRVTRPSRLYSFGLATP